jgi:hypothetical protein
MFGVPRQGRRTRVSLMAPRLPVWKRLAWMVAIWAASVATLGVVAGILRLWLRAGGV